MFPDLVDDVHYDVYVDVTTLKKKGWWGDRISPLIGMNTVTLSVVCKFIFAFPPENICVSVK